mmetsp:Transcript_45722/g.68005  ORF Transcript_45722/g.68005 Transcript_45722/m.68005 type:complete len:416 (-) Transcript_45722:1075-2322(-)
MSNKALSSSLSTTRSRVVETASLLLEMLRKFSLKAITFTATATSIDSTSIIPTQKPLELSIVSITLGLCVQVARATTSRIALVVWRWRTITLKVEIVNWTLSILATAPSSMTQRTAQPLCMATFSSNRMVQETGRLYTTVGTPARCPTTDKELCNFITTPSSRLASVDPHSFGSAPTQKHATLATTSFLLLIRATNSNFSLRTEGLSSWSPTGSRPDTFSASVILRRVRSQNSTLYPVVLILALSALLARTFTSREASFPVLHLPRVFRQLPRSTLNTGRARHEVALTSEPLVILRQRRPVVTMPLVVRRCVMALPWEERIVCRRALAVARLPVTAAALPLIHPTVTTVATASLMALSSATAPLWEERIANHKALTAARSDVPATALALIHPAAIVVEIVSSMVRKSATAPIWED